MITDLPFYIYATFFVALIYTLIIIFYASNRSKRLLFVLLGWGTIHSLLATFGFYNKTMTTPPRFLLMVFPFIGITVATIFSKKMQIWLSEFDFKKALLVSAVRIPVELVLYWLFTKEYVPEIMTFEGRNLDIIAGITAPVLAYFAFKNIRKYRILLLAWHTMSMLLLFNILFYALLSTPTILQQFGFEQPNIAVMKFPFLLLPAIIVPVVIVANMAGVVKLLRKDQ